MNTPNKLTLLRIVFVLPFIGVLGAAAYYATRDENNYKYLMLTAGAIFALAMLTD